MRIAAWNICHGGGERQGTIAGALCHAQPDVIVLTEYRAAGSEQLLRHLQGLGWVHIAASRDAGPQDAVAILSRSPIERRESPFHASPLRDWWLEAYIPANDMSVVGVYAPLVGSAGSSAAVQRTFWQAVLSMAEDRRRERVLLVGDFNTCAPQVDGTGPKPLPCSGEFMRLPEAGWTDLWRLSNPNGSEFTYRHHTGSLWRLDHAFATEALAGCLRQCRYSHCEREARVSDHSMLIVELAA